MQTELEGLQSGSKGFKWADDSPSTIPLLTQLMTPKLQNDDFSSVMKDLMQDFSTGARSPMLLPPPGSDQAMPMGLDQLPGEASRWLSPLSEALIEQQVVRPKSRRMLRWYAHMCNHGPWFLFATQGQRVTTYSSVQVSQRPESPSPSCKWRCRSCHTKW